MNQQVKVECLKTSDLPEVLELLIQAFKDYPFLPAFQDKPQLNKMLLKTSLCFCRRMRSAMLYGIRKEGSLVCVSLSVSSQERPSILLLIKCIFFMIRFSIFMVRAFGWRKTEELGRFFEKVFHKEKPKHKEPYLELGLFGTLPKYQRQGFGRKMLRFLYEEAKKRGYKGVIVVANRDTPAFCLYLKEGFIVEKEFTIGETTLSWMQLTF